MNVSFISNFFGTDLGKTNEKFESRIVMENE